MNTYPKYIQKRLKLQLIFPLSIYLLKDYNVMFRKEMRCKSVALRSVSVKMR